jgi:hypothetical protein
MVGMEQNNNAEKKFASQMVVTGTLLVRLLRKICDQ